MSNGSPQPNADNVVNQKVLVQHLKDLGVVASDNIAKSLQKTDRKYYSPRDPYIDAPQSIGYGATISAPHMHAVALTHLRDHLRPGTHVLDVGSGSGYLSACFLRFILLQGDSPNTRVVGIENQPGLVRQCKKNLNKDDRRLLSSGRLFIIEGDGRLGCSKHAPYDAIHVSPASVCTPVQLINQLANGGRLIAPIGRINGEQYLTQYDKDEQGNVRSTKLALVKFVPLNDLQQTYRR